MQTAVFISVSAGHPANLSFFACGSEHLRVGKPICSIEPEYAEPGPDALFPVLPALPDPLSVAQKG